MLPEENMKIQLFEEIASGAPFVAPILVARLVKMQHDPDGAHALSSLGVTVNVRIAVGAIVGEPQHSSAQGHWHGAVGVVHGRPRLPLEAASREKRKRQ